MVHTTFLQKVVDKGSANGGWEKLDGKDVAQRPYQDRTGNRRVDNFAKLGAQTQPQWEEEFAGQERGGRSLVFRFRVGIAAEV